MTSEQKNYSCTHGYPKAGECHLCIKMYNDMEESRKSQLAHIAKVRSEMKARGFQHARDYLNHLALR